MQASLRHGGAQQEAVVQGVQLLALRGGAGGGRERRGKKGEGTGSGESGRTGRPASRSEGRRRRREEGRRRRSWHSGERMSSPLPQFARGGRQQSRRKRGGGARLGELVGGCHQAEQGHALAARAVVEAALVEDGQQSVQDGRVGLRAGVRAGGGRGPSTFPCSLGVARTPGKRRLYRGQMAEKKARARVREPPLPSPATPLLPPCLARSSPRGEFTARRAQTLRTNE